MILEVQPRDAAGRETLAGAALVAADGAASLIRAELGLALEGPQDLSHIVNCYFRADIERYIGDRKGVLFFVSNEGAQGVLQPLDGAGRWLCQISRHARRMVARRLHQGTRANWVRAAVGVADLTRTSSPSGSGSSTPRSSKRLVQGRVVMCGDAAHQFPPTGGLGVNTGLQGMHNAMWKLAYCVQGKAGWPLLETYQTERRGVSQQITMQSLQNSMNVVRINAAAVAGAESGLTAAEAVATARRYGNHLGVEFGAVYASSAVIADGTRPPPVEDSYSDYVQSATPGCRAPHVWLGRPDAELSTLDLLGPAFTLLTAARGGAWGAAAAEVARDLGIHIDTYTIGAAGLDDHGVSRGPMASPTMARCSCVRTGTSRGGALRVRSTVPH